MTGQSAWRSSAHLVLAAFLIQAAAGCAQSQHLVARGCAVSAAEALEYLLLDEVHDPVVGQTYRFLGTLVSSFEHDGLVPFLSLGPREIYDYGSDAYCVRLSEECTESIQEQIDEQDPQYRKKHGTLVFIDALVRVDDAQEVGFYSRRWCAEVPVTVVKVLAARPMFPVSER